MDGLRGEDERRGVYRDAQGEDGGVGEEEDGREGGAVDLEGGGVWLGRREERGGGEYVEPEE